MLRAYFWMLENTIGRVCGVWSQNSLLLCLCKLTQVQFSLSYLRSFVDGPVLIRTFLIYLWQIKLPFFIYCLLYS